MQSQMDNYKGDLKDFRGDVDKERGLNNFPICN